MGLKLSTSSESVAAVAIECSEEALAESIDNVREATEALFECQADGQEICQVVDNFELIASALENGGLTAEFLNTFNAEGETLAAAGVESLTVEALEQLGEEQVKSFQDKLEAGLEGKMAEYWAKFVAWLKNLWARLVNWFKSIFVNRARYVTALGAAANMSENDWNGKAKVAALNLTTNKMDKIVAFEKDILAAITKIEGGAESIDRAALDKAVKGLDEAFNGIKESTVDTVSGGLAEFKKSVKTYESAAKSKDMQNAAKKMDAALKKLISEAGKAANITDGEKAGAAKDKINKQRELIVYCLGLIRAENKFCMKYGAQLVKIMKAAKTAKK